MMHCLLVLFCGATISAQENKFLTAFEVVPPSQIFLYRSSKVTSHHNAKLVRIGESQQAIVTTASGRHRLDMKHNSRLFGENFKIFHNNKPRSLSHLESIMKCQYIGQFEESREDFAISGCLNGQDGLGRSTHLIVNDDRWEINSFQIAIDAKGQTSIKELQDVHDSDIEGRSRKRKAFPSFRRFKRKALADSFGQSDDNAPMLTLEVAVLVDGALVEEFRKTFGTKTFYKHLISYVMKLMNFASIRFLHKSLGNRKVALSLYGIYSYDLTHPKNPTLHVSPGPKAYVYALEDLKRFNENMIRDLGGQFTPDATLLITGIGDQRRYGRAFIGGACTTKGSAVVQAKYVCPGGTSRAVCIRGIDNRLRHVPRLGKFEITVFLNSATIAHELGHTVGMQDLYQSNRPCPFSKKAGLMGRGHKSWSKCSLFQLERWLRKSSDNRECLASSTKSFRPNRESVSMSDDTIDDP